MASTFQILSMLFVGSVFWPSPSFKAQIPKLVKISGDSHLGAQLQCDHRAIAVLQTVATAVASPVDKEVGHCQDMLFLIIVSDVVSK